MANVFQAFVDVANNIRKKDSTTMLSGPFWFIQLCLNSIFKSHFQCYTRFSPTLELEGARLIYYTLTEKPSEETYRKFIEVILSTKEFTEELAPFVQPNIAVLACLKKNSLLRPQVNKPN